MATFSELVNEQKTYGSNIETIVRNFKKDAATRKQSSEYYEERLRRLNSEWENFETTDTQIRVLENLPMDHDYFTKEYYNTIMNVVVQYREVFETAARQLAASHHQLPAATQQKPAETQPPQGNQPESETNSFIKLVRRQGVMMASLERALNDTVSPRCQPVISKLWANIEDIHFKIFEMFDNPTQQGYSYDQFMVLEQRVRSFLQAADNEVMVMQSSSPGCATFKPHSVSLPKITISKFDGNYLKWQEFYDLFTQLVISQPLAKIQKMYYLKTHVVGEAGNLIKHFASTEENFEAAWLVLLERYNNKRLLVSKLINELLSTTGGTSMDNIKKLHDTTKECLLALNNLQIDTSTWDPLLIHLLIKKLDQPTRLRYEQSLSKPREVQTLTEFLQFLEKHFQSLEAMGIKTTNQTSKVCTTVTSKNPNNDNCNMCKKGKHQLFSCKEFLQQSPSTRFQFVQRHRYCHNCLKPGHAAVNCPLRSCLKCNKKHNTLLHFEDANARSSLETTPTEKHALKNTTPSTTKATASKQEAASLATAEHSRTNTYVLLSTAMVKVKGNGTEVQCRAILDSGSQVNFVTERLVKRLGISTKSSSISINGIGSSNTKVRHRVNIGLHSRINSFATRLEAAVLPHIISPQPSQDINIDEWKIPSNITLADPSFNHPNKIDILLGAEFYNQLMTAGQIKLSEDLPILQNTLLGWIVSGKIGGNDSANASCGICTQEDINLESALARLWQLDEVATLGKQLSTAEKQCETHFAQNTVIQNGRFMVKLPFHEGPEALGESFGIASNRFLALERRLAKSPGTRDKYIQFMEEYERLGHMTQVDINSINHPRYFIPHHYISRPESRTTKLRVVFDASAKSTSGISLNDLMYTGPIVQSELFTILLRFRMPKFVFTTDVEKMYRQILMHPEDRKFQLIIWRKDPSMPIRHYQLNTITYGTRSAPYLATKCLQTIAKENMLSHPLGSQFLQENFYVDDGIGGSDSLTTTMEIQQQLIHILKQRGLNLQKWCSNHPQLLENVGLGEQEVDIDFDNDINQTFKTLGMTWMPKVDKFCVKVCLASNNIITKRSVSADIARLFDPLGILAPIVVTAKIFIQDLWQLKLEWDEALPAELNATWTTFRSNLEKLNNMQVPRHVFEGHIAARVQIHVFSDASEKAYGAVIYIRSQLDDGQVMVKLLCAKSRVAPLKRQTLPRLELCASVLGAQLSARVRADLKLDVPTYYWTDSQIVLAWINSHSASYQTFVANRIAAIHEHTIPEQWRHIGSKDNPADIISRGLPPGKLEACSLWFNGPKILLTEEDTWPSKYSKANTTIDEGINMERRKVTSIPVTIPVIEENVLYNIRHNGSFKTLQKVIGYMLRFINRARKQSEDAKIPLTVHELDKSLMAIVQIMQQLDFDDELKKLKKFNEVGKNSPYRSLSPFLDNEGIIRVGGRLQASELPYEAKHPMLLPYNNIITKLLMQTIHYENRHCGPQALLSFTRQRFWPVKGRIMARSIVANCMRCNKAKPRLLFQVMGNLPSTRVTPARPFINSGVDFCGPFAVHLKIRGKKPHKAYIAVFCCFATKAVHLELVSDLTTQAFIGALKRFISRRGHCQNLYCDNATNFVGARNQLAELTQAVYADSSQKSIINQCALKGITFHFIPPRSPHFGGLWEAAVKSAKHLLVRSTSTASLTYEELDTVVIEVEGILNSRPISPMSDDPNDLTALTPGHFLIGEPINAQLDASSTTQKMSLLTRWKLVSYLKQEFWKRWSTEYLSELQLKNKWKNKQNNVKIGDMVIIKEDNTPVLQWPLGRVLNVFKGQDNIVRVAEVKTATGTCKRSIHRLAPLPMEENNEREPQAAETDEKDSPPKNNIRALHNGLAMLLITLLLIPLALGIQIENRRFGSKVGIHFEGIGSAAISSTEWNLIIYYDLKAFSGELAALSNGTKALSLLCQEMNQKSICHSLVRHFEQTEAALHLDASMMRSNRQKRGAINAIGNVAYSLFGILDSQYAEQMSNTVSQVNENESHLLNLIKNQTSIVDSTINIVKQDQIAVDKKFHFIDQQLSQIINGIRADAAAINQDRIFQAFSSLSTQLTLISANLQRIQSSILDVLTDSHHGKISPLLLTPIQLQQEINKIKLQLTASLELPVQQDDLLKLYQLMKVKGGVTQKHVIFSITLPLVEHDRFDLFNIVPIPNLTNGTMVEIDPCAQILAINTARDQFFPMSESEFQYCMDITQGSYICPKIQIHYSHGSAMCACEEALFRNHTQSSCLLRKTPNGFAWIPLHHDNKWIYATPVSSRATVVCGPDITQITLKGSGLLSLQPNCILKQHFVSIHAHQVLASSLSSSYTSLGEISKVAKVEQIKPLLHKLTDVKYIADTQNLTLLQSTLANHHLLELPHQLETQNTHHMTVGYAALLIAVCLLVFTIIKGRCKTRKHQSLPISADTNPSEQPKRPTPAPRHSNEILDFTVNV